jgi:hypothetical protein
MPLIILLVVLILIFGGVGYYMGPGLGYYGGGGLSLILALILIYLIFGRAAHGSSPVLDSYSQGEHGCRFAHRSVGLSTQPNASHRDPRARFQMVDLDGQPASDHLSPI